MPDLYFKCNTKDVCYTKAMKVICGLDEAGRGALAGPLVLASVLLPEGFSFNSLDKNVVVRDSKTLSLRQRPKAFEEINNYSLKTDIEIITSNEINEKGIQWANTEGFTRLILRNEADSYIVDGRLKLTRLGRKEKTTRSEIDADATIPSVSAAGIVAKVTHDEMMFKLHHKFLHYGWNTNVGYGTKEHINALKKFGKCIYHRNLFIKTALRNYGQIS